MKHMVTIGGGTGSFVVLSGLKSIPGIDISAIVSMADDGGTNGMLRRELGVLPPSDARQCLVALSNEDDPMRRLLDFRFESGTLSGHSFGSIFLAVLEKMTGDFKKAIRTASEILKISGRIIPITEDNAELSMALSNNTTLEGESVIDKANINGGVDKIYYKDTVRLSREAQEAMLKADYIIVCPGDFYTSLVPNFIVQGFKETIGQSRAKIILFINLVNKEGHTSAWRASDHLQNIEKYLGRKADIVMVNNGRFNGTEMVENDLADSRTVEAALVSEKIYKKNGADPLLRSTVRHDPEKIAAILEKIINKK